MTTLLLLAPEREEVDGAVLRPHAFALRFFGKEGDDCLLVVNLGPDLDARPASEPLLAPVKGGRWRMNWSSDDPRYGGPGAVHLDGPDGWRLPGGSAVFLSAVPA
jgi:maltooligosyltrehalose trehalohydrolase